MKGRDFRMKTLIPPTSGPQNHVVILGVDRSVGGTAERRMSEGESVGVGWESRAGQCKVSSEGRKSIGLNIERKESEAGQRSARELHESL